MIFFLTQHDIQIILVYYWLFDVVVHRRLYDIVARDSELLVVNKQRWVEFNEQILYYAEYS